MKKKVIMRLQLFADGEGNDGNGVVGNGTEGVTSASGNTQATSNGTQPIDYDKLSQILAGKQSVTEKSVIRGYFKQLGMSEDDMEIALRDFKQKQKQNDPANKVQELSQKVQQYENEKVLAKKNVKESDYDYVMFKVSKMVDKDTTFEKAVDKFLKENPSFATEKSAYKVSTSVKASGEKTNTANEQINDLIRSALRR